MTTIYFVRHAHSDYSTDEYGRGLSERGKEDAKQITERFRNENIDVVLSSTYQRAVDSVKGIADLKDLSVHKVDELKERTLAEHSVSDFGSAINKVWADPEFSFPGGESNVVAQHRAITCFLQLLRDFAGKRIVIGTHGNIMVLIMQYFDRNYDFEFWKRLTMPDVYRLTFDKEELIEVDRLWEQ